MPTDIEIIDTEIDKLLPHISHVINAVEDYLIANNLILEHETIKEDRMLFTKAYINCENNILEQLKQKYDGWLLRLKKHSERSASKKHVKEDKN